MDKNHNGSKLARDATPLSPAKIVDSQERLRVYELNASPPPLGPTLNEEETEKSKLERANFELKMQVFQLEKKLSETWDGVDYNECLESISLGTSQPSILALDNGLHSRQSVAEERHSQLMQQLDDKTRLLEDTAREVQERDYFLEQAEERHSQLMQQLDDKTRLLEDTAREVQERDYFLEQARGAIEHLQADICDAQNKYASLHEEKIQSDYKCDEYLHKIQLLKQSKNQLSQELALATKKCKDFEETKRTCETISSENNELLHQIEDAKVAYARLEVRRHKADADLKDCAQGRAVAERHLEVRADEIRSLREHNRNLSRDIEEFKKQSAEVEYLKQQIEERDVVLEQAKKAIETLQSAVQGRDQEKAVLEDLRIQADTGLKDSIKASMEADAQHCSLVEELAALKQEKKSIQHSMDGYLSTIQQLEVERNDLDEKVEKLRRSKADAISATLSSKADLHRAEEEKTVTHNELGELQLKYEDLCAQHADLHALLDEKIQQLRIVEQDEAGYKLQVHQQSSKISLLEGDLMSANDERSRLAKLYHGEIRKLRQELHSATKRAEDSDEKVGKATEEANAKDVEITALDRSLRDIKEELDALRHAKSNEETPQLSHNGTGNGGDISRLHPESRSNRIYYDLDCKHKELESLLAGVAKTVSLSNALVGRFKQIREENNTNTATNSSVTGTSQSKMLQDAQGLVLLESYCKQVLERNSRLSLQAQQIGKDLRIVYTRLKALEASLGRSHASNKSIDRRSIDRKI